MEYIQWKIKAEGIVDCFDNELQTRRDYGILKKEIKAEESGWVEMYARTTMNGKWELQQEYRLNMEEEEEDDEE